MLHNEIFCRIWSKKHYTDHPRQQKHSCRHNIFPGVVPQITFDLPVPYRKEPFQQNRTGCAKQGEENGGCGHPSGDAAGLKLPAYEKKAVGGQVTQKDEGAVRQAECPFLTGQKADSLFQLRIAGQQDADGRIQGKDGEAHRYDSQAFYLPEKEGQHTGDSPHDYGVHQIISMCCQVSEQVTPHGIISTAYAACSDRSKRKAVCVFP